MFVVPFGVKNDRSLIRCFAHVKNHKSVFFGVPIGKLCAAFGLIILQIFFGGFAARRKVVFIIINNAESRGIEHYSISLYIGGFSGFFYCHGEIGILIAFLHMFKLFCQVLD